jgi:hypothetical protein
MKVFCFIIIFEWHIELYIFLWYCMISEHIYTLLIAQIRVNIYVSSNIYPLFLVKTFEIISYTHFSFNLLHISLSRVTFMTNNPPELLAPVYLSLIITDEFCRIPYLPYRASTLITIILFSISIKKLLTKA